MKAFADVSFLERCLKYIKKEKKYKYIKVNLNVNVASYSR